jgi:hypothetical protein
MELVAIGNPKYWWNACAYVIKTVMYLCEDCTNKLCKMDQINADPRGNWYQVTERRLISKLYMAQRVRCD